MTDYQSPRIRQDATLTYKERMVALNEKIEAHEEWADKDVGHPYTFDNTCFGNLLLTHSVLERTSLKECRWSDMDLSGSSFIESDLSGSTMWDVDLTEADFTGANASNAFFNESRFVLSILKGANFSDCQMAETFWHVADCRGANFKNSCFHESNFRKCDFRDTDFTDANLYSSVFINVDFEDALLGGGFKQHTTFINCNLRNTTFKDADLSYSSFYGCDLENVDLTGATLTGVIGNGREIRTVQNKKGMVTHTDNASFKADHPNKTDMSVHEDLGDGYEY